MDMENKQPEGLTLSGGSSAPENGQIKVFSASAREKIAAFVMYLAAFFYVNRLVLEEPRQWYLAGFALLFVAMTELLHWGRPRSRESWVWLGCLAVILVTTVLHADPNSIPGEGSAQWKHVWNEGNSFLFLHVFAVWWVLSRSGALLEGESGHLLPLDALDGFVVFPFRHFFLRIRTVWYSLTHLRSGKKARPETLAWSVLALVLAAVLLGTATDLLIRADSGFGQMLSGVRDLFRVRLDTELVLRVILSLPVGAYLFGLIAGAGREDAGRLRERSETAGRTLTALRKVPNLVWTLLTGLFCLLYAAFFVVQARYLFGAFTRTLPEGFIVSQYARQGFFELCKVMAVNFALLWLVTRLSGTPVRQDRPALLACVVLLVESMLFAVVAFSKLMLYISCFGFTPLRLQSCWGVCTLFAGCVCALYGLLTGKKSFRAWMIFGAVTLAALHLY